MTGRPRSNAPKRDQVIKILVTSDLLALVTAAAKREGRSVSDWGQRLFEREVAYRGSGNDILAPGPSRSPQQMLDDAARALGWRTDFAAGGSPITWELVIGEIGRRAEGPQLPDATRPTHPARGNLRKRKRCPRCNQLLYVIDGSIERHQKPSAPFDECVAADVQINGERVRVTPDMLTREMAADLMAVADIRVATDCQAFIAGRGGEAKLGLIRERVASAYNRQFAARSATKARSRR